MTMHTAELRAITETAFRRGFGMVPRAETFPGGMIFFADENSCRLHDNTFHGKAVIFGSPLPEMTPSLGLRKDSGLFPLDGQDACPPAEGDLPFTESPGFLRYAAHPLTAELSTAMRRRPFTRFDYTDEWNNLGFGRIRTDGSLWAAHGGFVPDKTTELAGMFTENSGKTGYCGAYMTLLDTREASVLWCARPVGPVDSVEWMIVERFLSDWRPDDMPCLPCLRQTPQGCRCLVTMRLDCDEAVGSARDIFEWYKSEGIPFSLALKTSLELDANDLALLQAVRAADGTVLSHTHTHQLNWGTSPEEVQKDAESSRNRFADLWPSLPPVDLAVSPFHTNPPYAVQALARAGFTGFVSGIIHNDPEYLLGRAGIVPFADEKLVSISQQSMLHGDCYRRQYYAVDTHIAAFEAQYAARGIFGYLDHPFSERYQYDWENAEQRLRAHRQLITAIRRYEGVWFWSQQQCFDFVKALATVRLQVSSEGTVSVVSAPNRSDITYRYKSREHLLNGAGPL